jgi:hypothetical protein
VSGNPARVVRDRPSSIRDVKILTMGLHRFLRRLGVFAVCTLVSTSASAAEKRSASAEPAKPFFITIHVATSNPGDTDQRIADFIETANLNFAAAGISFVESGRKNLPASFAILETQGERHRLKKFFVPRTINVFLLDEIDDPIPSEATKKAAAWQGLPLTGLLAGAHVEYKGRTPGTYIILSRDSEKVTLTHELGHFFGAGHSKDPSNIMSYGREKHRFDDKQLQAFQVAAKRFRRQHILKY